MAAGEFDEVADELYALPPQEFIAARDSRAAQARRDGDRETARQINALRRPTVVAWLANRLVREHRDELEPLLELGAALREATATLSGPALRDLSRRRNEVVAALVRTARRSAGHPVSQDAARGLEDTLNAALADPDAGQALLTGRLTDALRYSGFGSPAGATATTPAQPKKPPARTARKAAEPTAEERAQAERRARIEADLEQAWTEARAAADARTGAEDALTAAQDQAAQGRRRADELRDELADAEAAHQRAADELGRATEATAAARDDAERATRRVTDLRAELEDV